MMDLIEEHRRNVAKAGLAMAEALRAATAEYNEACAASNLAMEAAIEVRIAAFRGETGAAAPVDGEYSPPSLPKINTQEFFNAIREAAE